MYVKSFVQLVLILVVKVTFVWSGGRPLKVYTKGYNGRNLPPGGWTSWFNVDAPYTVGDYEMLYKIKGVFGRGCQGVPCKRPIAVKAVSISGYSPRQEGNYVTLHPRRGLKCINEDQSSGLCADYKVRFYCPGMADLCRNKQQDNDNTGDAADDDDETTPSRYRKSKNRTRPANYNKERNRTIRKAGNERVKSHRANVQDNHPPLKHRWTTEEMRNRPTKQVKLSYKLSHHPRHGQGTLYKHLRMHDY